MDLLAHALDRSGHVVRRARTGRDIPGLVQIAPPEIVILDQDLREEPDALGWCRWLRTQNSTRLRPILLLTSDRLSPPGSALVAALDLELISKTEFRLESLLRRLERFRQPEAVVGAASAVAARFQPSILTLLPDLLREAFEAGRVDVGSMESLARREPGVALRLLSRGTANSGARERPRSIRDCLCAIGTGGLSEVLASAVVDPPADECECSLRRCLGRHALAVAEIAEKIAHAIRSPEPGSLYIAGLLHNLGQQALLAHDSDRYFESWEDGFQGVLLPDAERSRFHFSDAEVLLEIGKRWHLSMEILIPACSTWIDERRMGLAQIQRKKEIHVVRLAHRLASAYLVGAQPGDPIESPTSEMLAVLGLDGDALSGLASELMGGILGRVDDAYGAGEAWLPSAPAETVVYVGQGFDPVRLALARLEIPVMAVATQEEATGVVGPRVHRRSSGQIEVSSPVGETAILKEPFALGALFRALGMGPAEKAQARKLEGAKP